MTVCARATSALRKEALHAVGMRERERSVPTAAAAGTHFVALKHSCNSSVASVLSGSWYIRPDTNITTKTLEEGS